MALFPPEFIVGILAAFFQLRLRAYCSIASFLVHGLSFFLPPDDALIRQLNGLPPSVPTAKTTKAAKGEATPRPLPPDQKMQQFYIRVAKTEHGVFQHTLFFELYEMLVILVTSTLVACTTGEAVTYVTRHYYHQPQDGTTRVTADIAVYGLLSALLICLWFPLQVKLAQGLGSYESRLDLGIGALGFVLALFAIFAPKALLDFDLEHALTLAGRRIELVLRAIGFVDGDMTNLAPMAEALAWSAYGTLAMVAGAFACTAFLPSFRFARMYAEMLNDKQRSIGTKFLLHANVILPLLAAVCWIKPLTTNVLVPKYLIRCSPQTLTRDCFATPADEATFTASTFALKESQWYTLRTYVVLLMLLVRVLCFREHLQFFLVEPKDAIAQIVRRPGVVDGELLQTKVRIQFNYVPIIAIQYLAPVGAILASLVLLMRQTATSLGIFDAISSGLIRAGLVGAPAKGLAWFTPRAILPNATAPDLGGYRIGDDMSKDALTKVAKGMTGFVVVSPESYASILGFLIWWFTFAWFIMTVAGLVYWKNVPHVSTQEQELAAAAGTRRNRETPKLLKNQLKSLKLKKHL